MRDFLDRRTAASERADFDRLFSPLPARRPMAWPTLRYRPGTLAIVATIGLLFWAAVARGLIWLALAIAEGRVW